MRLLRRRPRHAWKGALHRGMYALLFSADRREWLRVFYLGPGDWLMLDLDNRPVAPEPLTTRMVRAVVEELRDGDPFVTVGVSGNEVRVGW